MDKVVDIFFLATGRQGEGSSNILRILAGLGQEDSSHPERKLWHHALFPPMVTSAVNTSQVEVFPQDLISNPNLAVDPNEFSTPQIEEAMKDITALRWSDGSETVGEVSGRRTIFAPRHFFVDRTLQLMQSILMFVLGFPEELAIDRFVANADFSYAQEINNVENPSLKYNQLKQLAASRVTLLLRRVLDFLLCTKITDTALDFKRVNVELVGKLLTELSRSKTDLFYEALCVAIKQILACKHLQDSSFDQLRLAALFKDIQVVVLFIGQDFARLKTFTDEVASVVFSSDSPNHILKHALVLYGFCLVSMSSIKASSETEKGNDEVQLQKTIAAMARCALVEDELKTFLHGIIEYYCSPQTISVEVLRIVITTTFSVQNTSIELAFLPFLQAFEIKYPGQVAQLFDYPEFPSQVSEWLQLCSRLMMPQASTTTSTGSEECVTFALRILRYLLKTKKSELDKVFSLSEAASVMNSLVAMLNSGSINRIIKSEGAHCLLVLTLLQSDPATKLQWQKRLVISNAADLLDSDWTSEEILSLIADLSKGNNDLDTCSAILDLIQRKVEWKPLDQCQFVIIGTGMIVDTLVSMLNQAQLTTLVTIVDTVADGVSFDRIIKCSGDLSVVSSVDAIGSANFADVVIVFEDLTVDVDELEKLVTERTIQETSPLLIVELTEKAFSSVLPSIPPSVAQYYGRKDLFCSDAAVEVLRAQLFETDRPLKPISLLLHGIRSPLFANYVRRFLCDATPTLLQFLKSPNNAVKAGALTLLGEACSLDGSTLHDAFHAFGLRSFEEEATDNQVTKVSGEMDTSKGTVSSVKSIKAANFQSKDSNFFSALDTQQFLKAAVALEKFISPSKLPPSSDEAKASIDSVLEVASDDQSQWDLSKLSELNLTNTTIENLTKVLQLTRNNAPILLEGGTGVGKSATIKAAAELTGKKLVRFNMSRTVTIDDLLGQIKMEGKQSFKFSPQPFTVAFQNGYWLLLDEINLAEEKVLQCIEEAIDTGRLMIQDLSSAEQTGLCIPMHEGFRLFATQNPNSGFFKGMLV